MRIPICIFFVILLVYACSGSIPAQEVSAKAEEYMAAQVEVNNFMGSVLVARDGEPLFRKGYGLANIEHDVPNIPETKFRLGSLTKQFTAAAVLLLQEKGLLDVKDPINKYIEDPPEEWEEITIHHLLTHTSGIPSFTDFPDYMETWMITSRPDKTLLRFKDESLDFRPGKKFAYSNSGYITLAVIIESASGMKYEEFLDESIFEPLGMKNSGHDTFEAVLKHRASGYVMNDGVIEHAPYHDMTIPIGGGDLYSTVDDMLLWDKALYTNRLLSGKSRKAMFTAYESGYGYGWGVGKLFKRRIHSHAGGINGFVSQIIRFPDDKVTVVVLCNLENRVVMDIGKDLAAIVLGEKYELPNGRDED